MCSTVKFAEKNSIFNPSYTVIIITPYLVIIEPDRLMMRLRFRLHLAHAQNFGFFLVYTKNIYIFCVYKGKTEILRMF
jgi:hypothetical protein